MKITFIANQLYGGGIERALTNIMNALVNNEVDVSVFQLKKDPRDYGLDERIKREIMHGDHPNNYIQAFKSLGYLYKVTKPLKGQFVVSFSADISFNLVVLSFLNRFKIVHSERGGHPPSYMSRKFLFILKILFKHIRYFVFQTDEAREFYQSQGLHFENSIVIPNPIKDDLPMPYTGERANEIVTFCRLDPQKNLAMLIKSFAITLKKHSDYTLKIYGDGLLLSSLKALSRDEGIEDNVIFLNFSDNIHQDILSSKMYVNTSDFEGISNAMLESLAIGLPTIATDCLGGGARMFIKDGINGFLVQRNDVSKLAERMNELIENSELSKQFSQKSVKIREELNSKIVINKWVDYFKLLME